MSSERQSSAADPVVGPNSAVDRTAGRYLLAIHWLAEPAGTRVSTGDLREYLDVSAASVTEMVEKLDGRGLVDHEKYRGVRLTDSGGSIATHLAWRFCVVTNFFGSVLETDLGDDESYDIGFTLPADGIDSLHELIDHPCVDRCPETSQDYDGCLL